MYRVLLDVGSSIYGNQLLIEMKITAGTFDDAVGEDS